MRTYCTSLWVLQDWSVLQGIARLCVLSCAWLAVSTTFADEDLELQVAELIEELDAAQQRARQSAEDQLIEIGIELLEHLPDIDDRMPRETRTRLKRVRTRLEKLAASEASKASLVTLEGKFKLSEAIQQIQEQTGNRIVDFRERFGQPVDELEVHLALKKAPFWQAIQQLIEQANLSIYPYSGESMTLALVADDPNATSLPVYWSTDKAFRFAAVSAVARRDLREFNETSLRLGIEVMWEPRLMPIVIRLPLDKLEAVGDNGEQIKVAASGETLESPVQPSVAAVELSIHLGLPTREVQLIKQFSAELSAVVPGRATTFEFADLAKARNVSKTQGGVTVTLVDTRENGAVKEVRVAIRYDQAFDALDSHRSWIFENELYLLGKEGEKTDHAGYELFRQKANEVGLSYKFTDLEDLADQKLVYITPATLSVQPLKIELENLPLP